MHTPAVLFDGNITLTSVCYRCFFAYTSGVVKPPQMNVMKIAPPVRGAPEAFGAGDETMSFSIGVIREIGDLPPGAVLDVKALAQILHRHPESVRRAVRRGELPRPTRLFSRDVWTVGRILAHIEAREAEAEKQAARERARLARLMPYMVGRDVG